MAPLPPVPGRQAGLLDSGLPRFAPCPWARPRRRGNPGISAPGCSSPAAPGAAGADRRPLAAGDPRHWLSPPPCRRPPDKMKKAGRLIARDTIGKRPGLPGSGPARQTPGRSGDYARAVAAYGRANSATAHYNRQCPGLARRPDPARASRPRPLRPRAAAGAAPARRPCAAPAQGGGALVIPSHSLMPVSCPGSGRLAAASPCWPCRRWPRPLSSRAAGAERDWLLIVEADGLRRDDDLDPAPAAPVCRWGGSSISRPYPDHTPPDPLGASPCTCWTPARASSCPPAPREPNSPCSAPSNT